MHWLTDLVGRHGLWLGLPAVFLGGLALNLTPCVYPMIPVTLAFFSSQAAGSVRRAAGLAACYVLGMSLCYAILGLLAATTGSLFGAWLQQPVVLAVIAAVIVALSLSMFGFYDLRLPPALMQRMGRASSGFWGAFVMGLLVGFIAAPCIGPFVLSLLLLVGRLGNPAAGFLLFFALGLGLGMPYVALGVAAHRVGRLPKAGSWLLWSKKVLGVVLLGLALYFLRPLLPERLVWIAAAGLLLGAGAYLGWLDPIHHQGRLFLRVRQAVGVALVLSAAVVAWPRPHPVSLTAGWTPYSAAALAQAQREQRPVLIDVYADWCIPCVEMDHVTFRHPDVARALSLVTTLRVDATREVSSEAQRLLEQYDVFGAPTALFFDRSGKEREDLRLSGFETPDAFLERLKRLTSH